MTFVQASVLRRSVVNVLPSLIVEVYIRLLRNMGRQKGCFRKALSHHLSVFT